MPTTRGMGMAGKRRRFTAEFKKRVVLEALRERDTVQAIASRCEVHPNQVGAWKRQAVESLDEVFSGAGRGLSGQVGESRVRRRRGLALRLLRSLRVRPARARPTLTALCSKHRLWKSRAANQPGHTLNQPSDCPVNQDHLKMI